MNKKIVTPLLIIVGLLITASFIGCVKSTPLDDSDQLPANANDEIIIGSGVAKGTNQGENTSVLNGDDTESASPEQNKAGIEQQEKKMVKGASPVLSEERSLDPEGQKWRDRIEKALAPGICRDIAPPSYPDTYYKGPLTDTHLHIPAIPDWSFEEDEVMNNEFQEGRFGGEMALLGWNVKMSDIACTITQEGTHKNFAFFPVYEGDISLHLLEIWNRTMRDYPEQFTPFIMSSGDDGEPDGYPTVNAQTLKQMLSVYPGLFDGYGEIGLYARENGGSPALSPDSSRLQEIYPVIKKNNLVVYFHLGDGDKDNFERVLKGNPNINFIFHGDQLSIEQVSDVLSHHENVYFGIDEFFGGEREIFELYVGKDKKAYLDAANRNFDTIVEVARQDFEDLIEKHPDRVLWGTDRGDAVWNYDLDVSLMQVKLARAFIGRLDPKVQENFAYRNAEYLIAKR